MTKPLNKKKRKYATRGSAANPYRRTANGRLSQRLVDVEARAAKKKQESLASIRSTVVEQRKKQFGLTDDNEATKNIYGDQIALLVARRKLTEPQASAARNWATIVMATRKTPPVKSSSDYVRTGGFCSLEETPEEVARQITLDKIYKRYRHAVLCADMMGHMALQHVAENNLEPNDNILRALVLACDAIIETYTHVSKSKSLNKVSY